MKKVTSFLAPVILLIVIAESYLYAASLGIINGCTKSDGSIYLIGKTYSRSHCTSNEQSISWNSEGIQGPAGPQGDKGGKGDVGARGPQGQSGENLKIVDSNNLEVGILLSPSSVWNSELKKYLEINLQDQIVSFRGLVNDIYYKDNDCSGSPMAYVEPYSIYNITTKNPYGWSHVAAKEGALFGRNILLESHWDINPISGICVNDGYFIRDVVEMEPVTVPEFQGPFKIVEQ